MCQNRIAIKILNHFWNAKSMITLNTVLHEPHEVHSGHSNWTRRYIYTYIHIYAWRAILRRKILYHRPAPVSATWATTLPPFPIPPPLFLGSFINFVPQLPLSLLSVKPCKQPQRKFIATHHTTQPAVPRTHTPLLHPPYPLLLVICCFIFLHCHNEAQNRTGQTAITREKTKNKNKGAKKGHPCEQSNT